MSLPKIVVDTDVFIDFLLSDQGTSSLLRRVMGSFFCYTTVFHAIRLFSLARSDRERSEVEHAMSAMKILGLSSKSAKIYGTLLSRSRETPIMNLLVAGLCLESKLPLLTGRARDFRGIRGLTVIPSASLRRVKDSRAMLGVYASHMRRN